MTARQAVRTLEEIAPEEETSESTRVLRASGIAGVLATIMIFGGQYLSSKGIPGMDADSAAWTGRVEGEEGAIETVVRLAGYGAVAFFVCKAAAGVLSSTARQSPRRGPGHSRRPRLPLPIASRRIKH